jgi:hypothetical protein
MTGKMRGSLAGRAPGAEGTGDGKGSAWDAPDEGVRLRAGEGDGGSAVSLSLASRFGSPYESASHDKEG